MRQIEMRASVALKCFGLEISPKNFQDLVRREKPKDQYHMRYFPEDIRAARYRYHDMEPPDFSNPNLFEPETRRPPPVIVTRMTKGGVGKTSTSVNLAGAMAMMGYRILLIDGDAQATASNLLMGREYAAPVHHHIGEFLMELPDKPSHELDNSIVHIYEGGHLDLIPSDIRLAQTDSVMPGLVNYHERAHRFFQRNGKYLSQRYDAIIVDTAPGSSPIGLTFSYAAKTAGKLLVVVVPEGDCLLALQVLKSSLDELRVAADAEIGIHVLINKHNPMLRHIKDNVALLEHTYPDLLNDILIPQFSGFARQINLETGNNKPLVESHPTSPGAVYMFAVAQSLIEEFQITMPGLPVWKAGG